MASIPLKFNNSNINSGLVQFGVKTKLALNMYFVTKAGQLEGKMKREARWTDRTGMARRTLTARVSKPNAVTYRITLSHGVDYGVHLEFANEHRYAIVNPTVKQERGILVKEVDRLMGYKKV